MSRVIVKEKANHFKMKTIAVILFSLASLSSVTSWVQSGGRVYYTAVSPSEIRPNSLYPIIATVEKAPPQTRFLFTITHGAEEIIVSRDETIKEKEQTSIFLQIPTLLPSWRNYTLTVKVFPPGQYPSEERTSLTCSYVDTSLIIQTDKSTYKPNDLIQYRVLLLDRKFRPLDPPHNVSVAIRNPDGHVIHAISNKSIPSKRGFISDKVKLSSEPKTGEWKIQAFVVEGPDSSSSPAPSYSTIFEAPKSQTPAPIYMESVTFHVQKYNSSKVKLNLKISSPFVTQKSPEVTASISPIYNSWKPLYGECTLSIKQLNIQSGYEMKKPLSVREGSTAPLSVDFNTKTDLHLQAHEIANEPTLAITATCLESTTGKSYEESIDFKMFKYPYQIQLISNREYLKPKMNHSVRIRITSPYNNKPIMDADEIQVQYVRKDKPINKPVETLLNPSDGEFLYSFNIDEFHLPQRYISLIVTYKELNQTFDLKLSPKSYFEKYLVASINQNLSSLSIPKEGKDVCLEIKSSFELKGLSIIGLSNGDIVYNNYLTYSDLVLCGYSIPIRVPKRVAPFMTFVVYTVDLDREFVSSDVSHFYVEQAPRAGVDLTLSTSKSQHENNVTIRLKGISNSIIGLRAVDELVLQDNEVDDDFSETRLISAGYRFESKLGKSEKILKGDNTERDMRSCGLTLISNFKRESDREKRLREDDESRKIPREKTTKQPTHGSLCWVFGWIKKSWFCVEPSIPEEVELPKQVERETNVPEPDENEEPIIHPQPQKQKIRRFQNHFPDTWIWEEVELSNKGLAALEKTVPSLNLNFWRISAFQINQGGIGFSHGPPVSLEVTTPFFLSMDLPYSIVKGEDLTVQVLLYNNQNTSRSFNVTLVKENTQINFVNAPQAKEISESTIVNAASVSTITFIISAVEVGTEKLIVTAIQDSDNEMLIVSKPLIVKPEGMREENNNAMLIDLRDSSRYSNKIAVEVPPERVAGGDLVRVSLVGDILGSLTGNLKKLMLLPGGCGEQNIAKFILNTVILDHMDAMGTDLAIRAIENLRTGYQIQLNYRRSDGSFSTWGNSDSHGSTWLTANVVDSFIKATKYITIDESIISQSLQFLSNQQKRGDGSFTEKTNHQVSPTQNSVALTGLVLLAFKTSQDNKISKVPSGKSISEIINDGKKFLSERLEESLSPYETALTAYVLGELNSRQSSTLLDKLKRIATTNKTTGLMYWNAFESPERSGQHVEMKPNSVETTGYALMAFIGKGQLQDSFDIARWILTQMNSNGGFKNSQDTVVGISALAKFAEAQKLNNSSVEMRVDVFPSGDNDTEPIHTFYIGENNRTILQEFILSDSLKEIYIRAEGKGTAFCQLTSSYYVDKRGSTGNDLELSINQNLRRNGAVLDMRVCVAVIRGEKTNKAIIEANSPSGFEFDDQSLDLLKEGKLIKKWELQESNSRVYLYLESVKRSDTCFNLVAVQTNLVSNTARAYAKVYDYYNMTRSTETFYSITNHGRV